MASNGFGAVERGRGGALTARTAPSRAPGETHAFLATGPRLAEPLNWSARVITDAQLRTGAPPNAWESAWLVWGYRDRRHFYYFAAKPTGWELGKRDPAFRGGQRFLADGASPAFPVGVWTELRVMQDDARIRVYADGRLVVDFTDVQRPYRAGRIGFYGEDCAARLADVRISGEDQLEAGDHEHDGEHALDRGRRQAAGAEMRADRAAGDGRGHQRPDEPGDAAAGLQQARQP